MIPKKIHYCWFGGNPLPQDAIVFVLVCAVKVFCSLFGGSDISKLLDAYSGGVYYCE